MADLNEIMKERLTKTFAGETQEVTARRLSTTQGNVSKWKSGSQVPTPDMLLTISKAYKVSVDWLMGVSNEPEIDGLVLEKLTYEQIAKVFDMYGAAAPDPRRGRRPATLLRSTKQSFRWQR